MEKKNEKTTIERGDIFYCNFGRTNILGSEQLGMRPVVVLQNNLGNTHSPTVIVATITTKEKRLLPTHVRLYDYPYLKPFCTVLLEQMKTIDKQRLHEYVTSVTEEDMKDIERAMKVSLGLE